MSRPVIALLTDFGTRDHYAGTLKGVLLTVCPDATLVDITHEVPPHDVFTGALELAACYRYFPPGTIFLVVIDPGVGSARRPIAIDTGEYRFVAPDNGVLSVVLEETPPKRIVVLSERRYARPTVSRTFEGRDRFAPAAAWLARGLDLKALGRIVTDYQSLHVPVPDVTPSRIAGEIVRVDRFGNLVSNIDRHQFDRLASGRVVRVRVGDFAVERVVATYAESGDGEVCALFGSTDHLEIAVNGGSAAERLQLGRGAKVEVEQEQSDSGSS